MNDRFRIEQSRLGRRLSFSPRFCRRMNLIAKYDTRCFNLGANALIARHVFVQVLLQENCAIPSCGLCFEFEGLWWEPEKRIGTAGVVAEPEELRAGRQAKVL